MNILGKTPRKYPFRGGQITAKEAADHFNISIKTMYNRLTKCGDNMESAYAYYESRFGGGNEDMKKLSLEDHERMDRQRAEDEILGILCGSGASVKQIDLETGTAKLMDTCEESAPIADPAMDTCESAPEASPKLRRPDDLPNTVRIRLEETGEEVIVDYSALLPENSHPAKTDPMPCALELDPIQKQIDDQQLHSLTLYNTAISALHALAQEGIDDFEASQRADGLLEMLKCVRINTFEHMVPWDAIAKGAFK